jgi:glycosyltransferase involved in cell wall biosynthesis
MELDHARRADVVAPPCEDLCRYAREVWKLPADRLRLTPHPYTPRPELLALEPRREGFTVGFVGRLEKRKGIETLVPAIPRVLQAVPQARFRLIGAPSARPATGQMYDAWIREKLGANLKAVELPGKATLDQMPGVYDALDVCAFPSLWENFPNVCLEAMSGARAVVGSSAGGMAEMLDRGSVGRLVEPGNVEQLAELIIELLRDNDARIRLGRLARQRVIEHYNEEVIGSMMEGVYKEAIRAKAASAGTRVNRCAQVG